MAQKLGKSTASNVTQLPTRAARGAGKSKPGKAPPQMKSAIPKARGSVKDPPITDVEQERKLREALQLRLIGYRKRHHDIDVQISALREEIKEQAALRKEVRNAIEGAGMPLALFDESYADARSQRVDLARKEKLRAIIREAYGLPAGPQESLLDKIPTPAQASVYWRAEGYKLGIAGVDPESTKCPGENLNDLLAGHHDAMKANAEGLKAVTEPDEKRRTPLTQAQADAKAKGGEGQETIVEPPAGARPDELKGNDGEATEVAQARVAAFSDDELKDALHEAALDPDVLDRNGRKAAELFLLEAWGHDMDDFEATPAELARQGARRAIQEGRAADDEAERLKLEREAAPAKATGEMLN